MNANKKRLESYLSLIPHWLLESEDLNYKRTIQGTHKN